MTTYIVCRTTYIQVLIEASNRKTELRFMVSDWRGSKRPQPGSINVKRKRNISGKKKQTIFSTGRI